MSLANELIPLTASNYSVEEQEAILHALYSQRLEGSGFYSKKVQDFFCKTYGFTLSLFTPSGTDALELLALLCDLKPEDEVVIPSYTFPTSAHAFVLRGARVVLADSSPSHPNMNLQALQEVVSDRTKAVCVVHYGGVGLEIDKIADFCKRQSIWLIEDAAQAIDSYYGNQPLGSFGDGAAFSFHQTKNISCGEGGMAVIQQEKWLRRAEIIREKGTNRQAFLRGEVDKYTCVDIGSSFVGSDLHAALLWAQLQKMNFLHQQRRKLWEAYYQAFRQIGVYELAQIPPQARHNAHNFFIVLPNQQKRDELITYMRQQQIQASFHFVALHMSPFYSRQAQLRSCYTHAQKWSECLVRLPLFPHMSTSQWERIVDVAQSFARKFL